MTGHATEIGDASDAQLAALLRHLAAERSHRELTADDAALIIAIRVAAERLDRQRAAESSHLHVDVAVISEATHDALGREIARRLREIATDVELSTGPIIVRSDWPDIDAWVHYPGQSRRSGAT